MTSEILRFIRGTCWKDGSNGGCRLLTLTARKQCSRSRNGPTTERVVPAGSKKIHLRISLADAECAMYGHAEFQSALEWAINRNYRETGHSERRIHGRRMCTLA